jgi:hypothetical protein
MLRNLEDEPLTTVVCLEGVENGRKLVGIEFYIYDGTNDLMDLAMEGGITRKACRGSS